MGPPDVKFRSDRLPITDWVLKEISKSSDLLPTVLDFEFILDLVFILNLVFLSFSLFHLLLNILELVFFSSPMLHLLPNILDLVFFFPYASSSPPLTGLSRFSKGTVCYLPAAAEHERRPPNTCCWVRTGSRAVFHSAYFP